MTAYQLTPAKNLEPAERWPHASRLVQDSEKPTLVMFVHPGCPCSRSSLGELSILATRHEQSAQFMVAFFQLQDREISSGWFDLIAQARRIRGVHVVFDYGQEASRFGATTSGETFLYGPSGELLFRGGITAGRGHHGDNAGRLTLERILSEGARTTVQTNVYGCCLRGD